MSGPDEEGISRKESLAFASALLINLVDQMGPQFTIPVYVTYATWIGSSITAISFMGFARGAAAVFSNFWMPKASDRCGRKWIAFTSLVGCAVGYAVQGAAYLLREETDEPGWGMATVLFIIGRVIVGGFSGMQPVIMAYIAELSIPDKKLMTQRLVYNQVAGSVLGIALAPIAGFVATFGLQIPFLVCSGFGVFAVFFCLVFFKESWVVKGRQDPRISRRASLDSSVSSSGSIVGRTGGPLLMHVDEPPQPVTKLKSPARDVVVVCMFFAYLFLFLIILGSFAFLMPLYLYRDNKFGIKQEGDTEEDVQKKISSFIGLLNIPSGILSVLTAVFGYAPITSRFGERPTVMAATVLLVCVFPLLVVSSELWHLFVVNALVGLSTGIFTPALGPVSARYASVFYQKQMAMAQSVPILGLQLAGMFCQIIDALFLRISMEVAWIANSFFAVAACVFFYIAHSTAEKRIRGKSFGSASQQEVALKTEARSLKDFEDAAVESLRTRIQRDKATLFNGATQFLFLQNLERTTPDVREWNNDTGGREHLEDVLQALAPYPMEFEHFRSNFPHVKLPEAQGGGDAVAAILSGFGVGAGGVAAVTSGVTAGVAAVKSMG